ncbi:SemiSWEET family transporter [Cardiobacterium hominis]|uniref:SemiSWEET family transporter n=1 Tax=Cardiobacterium hominis TaxID=2718 RepID=UPI0028D00D67|nr:SemiSWEET family transporter [Cardiobacterium hominis]
MHDKHIRILAIVATIAAICMYTSYIFQIQENLAGHKASPIQPLCAAINCTLWVVYGLFKTPRDLPVAIANAPGVVLGIITCITSF